MLDAVFLPHEIVADPKRCLLEQGLLCCGPATRGGCGALCIEANMPCTGCYGPPFGVNDQGAKMISAIATLFTARTRRQAESMAERVLDPAGTFYRYALPVSLIDDEDL
jgi:F420-non-reducing hydrogenase small subunit